jgi:CRISPR-associated protein Csd1
MTVLQALDHYYGRMAARHEVVSPGWSEESIGVVLELAEDGSLLSVKSWLDDRSKPRRIKVPKWFSRSGTGSTPNFLWDNAAYALGWGAKDPGKTTRDHAAFKVLHLKELAAEADAGLRALCRFLEQWNPANGLPPGFNEKQLAHNIGFQLRGDERLLHERAAVAAYVDRLASAGPFDVQGFCLVRGDRLPLVRLHPKIKGINGAASAEIPLVSCEPEAFRSYGKVQGFNAPTSTTAAFRYGAALNELLKRGGRNRLNIADSTVAFWANASAYDTARAEAVARAAEDVFGWSFGNPAAKTTDDIEQTASVREALVKVAAARAEQGVTPALLEGVQFHVLGLAPNVARVAIRYWVSDSFSGFSNALDRHAQAVAIEPPPWRGKPPGIERLLVMTTVLQEKFENISNGLAGEVMRAVLTAEPYPRTWLAATVLRLRAGDNPGRGWHAAAIKACLSRMKNQETPPVSLDPDNPSPAYQLGRLFAVLDAAQYSALGRVNASIAARYYGAASSTPARVFGALTRSARTHVSDIRKLGRGLWIERRLQQIIDHLPSELPHTLRLEDQGRFAIGYYHERAHRPGKADAEADEAVAPDTKETV